ncbi:MAG: DMT family transporter [Desulfomonile sp.]|nr:DMT family transporter [Desulfomonile sp.]
MEIFYIMLALLAGACAPTQAAINSQLKLVWAGDPAIAALISFAVGTLTLLAYVLVLRLPWPSLNGATVLPWWLWTGGVLGAFLVWVTVITAFKLGATTMIAILMAGQIITSLVLDHYGLIGYETRPATLWRIVGAGLLVTGVLMIKRF